MLLYWHNIGMDQMAKSEFDVLEVILLFGIDGPRAFICDGMII